MSAAARLAAGFADPRDLPSAEELAQAGVYGTVTFVRPAGTPIGPAWIDTGTHLDEPSPDVATYGKQTVWATDAVLLREAAEKGWHRDARQLIHTLGIDDDIIDGNLKIPGVTFRLCLYSQEELPAGRGIVLATWAGLQRVAEAELPEAARARLAPHWETIRATPKEDWVSDPSMAALATSLGAAGRMTAERYAAMDPPYDTPAAGRRLLHDRFNALTQYYTGDGYTEHAVTWTKTPYREYFAPNLPLASIPAGQQVSLTVLPK